ncbi:MAG: DUF2330 domain-containing protein [Planctomycetota bacterium]|nr:DUF2330 domain-containing protein [Planctomycetota bacterium]
MRFHLSLLFLSLLLLLPSKGDACCPAGSQGSHVQIADQEILVVWDEVNKREHFIRQAKFETDSENYGFLVPTPTKPELAEADAAVFKRLSDTTKPVVKTNYHYHFGSIFDKSAFVSSRKTDSKKASVTVLDRKRIAGYDAVVLRADDPKALGEWLESHGYEFREDLIEWVRPYIEAHWIVTAFKFVNTTPKLMLKPTKAIRMSFDTEHPLFPYRVPEDNLSQARSLLRVHFVGPKRVVGKLGKERSPWAGKIRYAKNRDDIKELLAGTGPAANVSGTWLTSFDDKTWPGGAEDLYFDSAPSQESFITVIVVEKDIFIVYEFIIGLIAVVGFVIGFAMFQRKKRAKAKVELQ